jgi:hypothetical protein
MNFRMTLASAIRLSAIFTILFSASQVHADEGNGIEFSGSGFYTIAVGKMLSGSSANVQDYNCPCYISDYAQAGVYDGSNGLQWKPDSKLGVQGIASYDSLSVTTQVVARGASQAADLEWLYASYILNDKITIQAGRKRLPMFYYSDVQDIGFVLPWVHLPSGPYGWEAVNYNGISMRYQDRWGEWSATADLLAGNESNNNSGYWKIYNGRQSLSTIKWSNIVGGNLTLSKDWFEMRAVYIQSNTEENQISNGWNTQTQAYDLPPGPIYPQAQQKIYGLALNADYLNWLVRTEFIQIEHPGLNYMDHAELAAVGYRYGKWQPMATWSIYRGSLVTEGVLPTVSSTFYPNMQQTVSLTIRYDLTATSDLKLQYDQQTDHSDPSFTPNYGNADLLTFAYDSLF